MEPIKNELSKALGLESSEFIDARGNKHRLCPLDMSDIAELERKYKGLQNLATAQTVDDLLFVLWLSLRKDGLSEHEIDNEKWKLTVKQVGRMFPAGDKGEMGKAVVALYRVSGFPEKDVKKAKEQVDAAVASAVDAVEEDTEGAVPDKVVEETLTKKE